MPFNEQLKQEFIETFSRKAREKGGPNAAKCPLCTNNQWTTVDGYVSPRIEPEISAAFYVGGPTIPTVPIVCNNCGFVAHISLGVLGLLPAKDAPGEATA